MKKQPPADGIVQAAGVFILTSSPPEQFLLMRHPDRWDLPKGHCEPGETLLETALREMEEETGISQAQVIIDPGFHFQISYPVTYKKWPQQSFQKKVHYYLGRVNSCPTLRLTEHTDHQWFEWAPPHQIQEQTIDPLLATVETHLRNASANQTNEYDH